MRTNLLLWAGLLLNTSMAFAQVSEYAGCKEEDYVTITEPEVQINFQGSSYEPACVKIKKGTKVIVPASSRHPMLGAKSFNQVINPLRAEGEDYVTPQTLTPETLGFYGYYCTRHGDAETGDGMGGMIWVVE